MKINILFMLILLTNTQSKNLISNNDDLVLDVSTNIMWERKSSSKGTWLDALSSCRNSNTGGYNDWLLPNINELQSIINFKITPSMDNSKFYRYQSEVYWSSTVSRDSSYARCISFEFGKNIVKNMTLDGSDNNTEDDDIYYKCIRYPN